MEYVLFHLLERNEKCGSIFRRNTLILVLLQWVETELE